MLFMRRRWWRQRPRDRDLILGTQVGQLELRRDRMNLGRTRGGDDRSVVIIVIIVVGCSLFGVVVGGGRGVPSSVLLSSLLSLLLVGTLARHNGNTKLTRMLRSLFCKNIIPTTHRMCRIRRCIRRRGGRNLHGRFLKTDRGCNTILLA